MEFLNEIAIEIGKPVTFYKCVVFFFELLKEQLIYLNVLLSRPSLIALSCIILFLYCSSVGFYIYGKHLKKKLIKVQSWPTVQGVVVESEVLGSTNSRVNSNINSTTYSAQIKYTYTVFNKQYTNSKLNWGGRFESSSKEQIQAYADMYPVGKELRVYYNETDPKESIVDIDIKGNTFIYKLGVFMCIIIATGFLCGLIIELGNERKRYEEREYEKYQKSPQYQEYLLESKRIEDSLQNEQLINETIVPSEENTSEE
ncbi:MAG: DUF3592 domain-containing protein [Fibrobacter sp.]|nr:DUF3592 domain-containing protein [Fibrobacter sp.]